MGRIVVPVAMYDSNMTTISPLTKKLQRIKGYFPNMVTTSINRLDRSVGVATYLALDFKYNILKS